MHSTYQRPSRKCNAQLKRTKRVHVNHNDHEIYSMGKNYKPCNFIHFAKNQLSFCSVFAARVPFCCFFFLFCSKIFSIKKTQQIIFIFREKPTPRLITTQMEMTEGMRVWTSPRPEGSVKKIRVTSAWMNCTSRLRRPGKGGRLKMRTASKR